MTGQVTMRWYDHKAYTVVVDGAETAAFAIAIYRGWELRLRPAGPLDPGPDFCRVFASLGDTRDWLRTGEGQAWLDRIRQMPPVKTRPIPTGYRGTDRHGRHQCLTCWGWRHPANHSCPGVPQPGQTPPPTPRRIQRSRQRGRRMPEDSMYVGRPTVWGNPFVIGQQIGCDDAATAVDLHRGWLEQGFTAPYPLAGETAHLEQLREQVLSRAGELVGRDLVCWCPLDRPCHADALLELAVWTAGVAARPAAP